jgi:Tfp pilus assembly protein PilO
MEALKKSRNLTIVAMLAIAALAIAFWALALSPKREEATKLADEIEQVEFSLAQHRAEIAEAEEARSEFSRDYQQLVVLGKAVPGDDDTPSLLVQVSSIAERTGVEFQNIELDSSGGSGEAPPAPASAGETPVSATEAAAALLPLGASVGPAGLAAMPYTLTFNGSFFKIADFIKELDKLVKTESNGVVVDGRLMTLDGFLLEAGDSGFPSLSATFAVTTYLTPPGEGVGLGAGPAGPGSASATPAATKLGGAQ